MSNLARAARPVSGRGARLRGPGRGFALAALALFALAALPAASHAQGTLSAIEQDVERIARRARPCVVTVIAQRTTGRQGQTRRLHSRVGSGVALSADGIVTTASVVLGAERVLVVTENHLQAEARVVGMDPVRNLALLRPEGLELASLPLASKPAVSGDWAITLGNSYGGAPTQSVGNVAMRFSEPGTSLLQLSNEVHPGNSGGAALNSRGELLGLVQGELGAPAAPGQRERAERRPGGISFAIPVEDIVPFLDGLAKYGRVRHGMCGVSTRAAFVTSASDPSDRVPLGALVEAVQPGGPAARLGLKKGDLVVAFNGVKVEYPEQLARWVAVAGPGAEVKLVWVRDELGREGSVKLDEAPSAIPSWMRAEPVAPAAAGAGLSGNGRAALEPGARAPSRSAREQRGLADTTGR
jgi:serine protease Do